MDLKLTAEFKTLRELGRGGFGCAKLVERSWDQKKLVIKEVELSRLTKIDIEKTREEAKFLAELQHSNIVRYEGICYKIYFLVLYYPLSS